MNRTEFLDTAARACEILDPEDYPFTRAVVKQLRDHDDREQYLAGVDLILDGITAAARPGSVGDYCDPSTPASSTARSRTA